MVFGHSRIYGASLPVASKKYLLNPVIEPTYSYTNLTPCYHTHAMDIEKDRGKKLFFSGSPLSGSSLAGPSDVSAEGGSR